MRVFLVTHCQPKHVVENKIGGWYDTSLTGLGVRHAKSLAKRLQGVLTDGERRPQLFSSDLLRAHETAEHLARAIDTDVRLRHELRGLCCGVAEGETLEWLSEHGQSLPADGDRLHYKPCAGAESRFELAARAYPFVKELIERGESDTVLVTHGSAHDVIVGAWLGMPPATLGRLQFTELHGGLTTLVTAPDGTREVATLNDHAHLDMQAR